VLWGQALSGVVIEDGLVWASIPLAATRAAGLPEGEDAGLVNFLLATQGTRAAAVLNERSDGTVDVSLRSLPGVDVAAVAAAFGGGGHRQAAGCTVPGTLSDVADRILARLRQAVDEASLRSAVS
jgi:phosphoesterase RecJ-like protein